MADNRDLEKTRVNYLADHREVFRGGRVEIPVDEFVNAAKIAFRERTARLGSGASTQYYASRLDDFK